MPVGLRFLQWINCHLKETSVTCGMENTTAISIEENRHHLFASLYREAYKSNLGHRFGAGVGAGQEYDT